MKVVTCSIILVALLGISTGCSTFSQRHPVPVDQLYRAQIFPGVPALRAWAGTFSEQFEADLVESVRQEIQSSIRAGKTGFPTLNILTLSGGAEYGAFGAGFMNGWSESGTRPVFKFVTGISAGALIAPFAFLGQEYDGALRKAFTTITAKDIYLKRGISALWSDSLTDSSPLAGLIEKYFNQDVFKAVAKAHRQGRRLYVGTTNMDADRLVVWNMGAIANSGRPGALELFHQVILASASIPLTFPPVFINVEVDGVSYDEMHVDGGVKAQLFLTAATIDMAKIRKQLGLPKTPEERTKLYIIRNALVEPEPKPIPRKLNSIMDRALSLLIKSHATNDLFRIYNFTQEQGFGFNWVALPDDYKPLQTEPFNFAEMNRLFKIGYEMGKKENAWQKVPPVIH